MSHSDLVTFLKSADSATHMQAVAMCQQAAARIEAQAALIAELVEVLESGRDYVSDLADGLFWMETMVNGEKALRQFKSLASGDLARIDAALTRAKEAQQ